jgi:hypothetical protein
MVINSNMRRSAVKSPGLYVVDAAADGLAAGVESVGCGICNPRENFAIRDRAVGRSRSRMGDPGDLHKYRHTMFLYREAI